MDFFSKLIRGKKHSHVEHVCIKTSDQSKKRSSSADTDVDFIQQVVEELVDRIPEKSTLVESYSKNSLSNNCVGSDLEDTSKRYLDTVSDTDVTEYESAADTELSGKLSSSASLLTFSDQLNYEQRDGSCSCSLSGNKHLECVCSLKLSQSLSSVGDEIPLNTSDTKSKDVQLDSVPVNYSCDLKPSRSLNVQLSDPISPTSSCASPDNNFVLIEEASNINFGSSYEGNSSGSIEFYVEQGNCDPKASNSPNNDQYQWDVVSLKQGSVIKQYEKDNLKLKLSSKTPAKELGKEDSKDWKGELACKLSTEKELRADSISSVNAVSEGLTLTRGDDLIFSSIEVKEAFVRTLPPEELRRVLASELQKEDSAQLESPLQLAAASVVAAPAPFGAEPAPAVVSITEPLAVVESSAETAPLVVSSAETAPVVESSAEPLPVVESSAEPLPVVASSAETAPLVASSAETAPLVASSAETAPLVASSAETAPLVASSAETAPLVASSAETAPLVASSAEPAPVVASSADPLPPVASREETVQLGDSSGNSTSVVDSSAEFNSKPPIDESTCKSTFVVKGAENIVTSLGTGDFSPVKTNDTFYVSEEVLTVNENRSLESECKNSASAEEGDTLEVLNRGACRKWNVLPVKETKFECNSASNFGLNFQNNNLCEEFSSKTSWDEEPLHVLKKEKNWDSCWEKNKEQTSEFSSLSQEKLIAIHDTSPLSNFDSSLADSFGDQSTSSCGDLTRGFSDSDAGRKSEGASQSESLAVYVSENFSFVAAEASRIAEDIFNALEDLDSDGTLSREYKMSSLADIDSDVLDTNYPKLQCDQTSHSLAQNYYLDESSDSSNAPSSLRAKKTQDEDILRDSSGRIRKGLEMNNSELSARGKDSASGECMGANVDENTKSSDLKKDSMYKKLDNLVDVVNRSSAQSFLEEDIPTDSSVDDNENTRTSRTDELRSSSMKSQALEYVDKLISLSSSPSPRNRSSAASEDTHPSQNDSKNQESSKSSAHPSSGGKWSDMSNIDVQKLPERLNQLREVILQQESLHKEEIKKYQRKLKTVEEREQQLGRKMFENSQGQQQMSLILEEYEKTISRLVAEKEHERQSFDLEKENLIKEKDAVSGHLSNIEIAFSDVHQKYEKSKQVIQGFKNNEEALRATVSDYEAALKKQEQKYEILKSHAMTQLESANQELIAMRRTHEAENSKLKAMLKKAEIKIHSLEETLQQKIKENQELVNICDELIGKVGSSD